MTRIDFARSGRTDALVERVFDAWVFGSGRDTAVPGFPPYDLEQLGDDRYRITLAVAGFDRENLSVEIRDKVLMVTGRRNRTSGEPDLLHRGIAAQAFQRAFQLADGISVHAAHLDHGLLHIDLVREQSEASKPRRIAITTRAPSVLPARLASEAKKLVRAITRKAA